MTCLCDVCDCVISRRQHGFVTLVHGGSRPCEAANVVHVDCGPEGYSIFFVQLVEDGLPFWLEHLSHKRWMTPAALEAVRRAHRAACSVF